MWVLAPLGQNSHYSHQDYVKIRTDSHQLDIFSHLQDIVESAIIYSLDANPIITDKQLTRALLGLWIFHRLLGGGAFERPPP